MATKNTNKTIFAIGIVVILGYLAYKLWPAIQKKLNSSSGGGSTGGGAGSAGGGNPYGQQPQSGQGPSISFGGGPNGSGNTSGIPGAGGNNQNAFTDAVSQVTANLYDWLDGFEALGSSNIDTVGTDTQTAIDVAQDSEDDTIPTVPLQNFDVSSIANSPDDSDGTDYSSYDGSPATGGDGTGLGDYGFAYGYGDGGGGDGYNGGDSSPDLDYAVDDSGGDGDDGD